MRYYIFILFVFSYFFTFSQEDLPVEYAATITVNDLSEHLHVLASDALRGRETGDSGQKMAAAYIGHYFSKTGLEPIVLSVSGPSFFQKFDLLRMQQGEARILIKDRVYENFSDFVYAGITGLESEVKSRLLFTGNGHENTYKTVDVKGKNVLIYHNGDHTERNKKAMIAAYYGAKHIFIIQAGEAADFSRNINMYKRIMSNSRLTITPPEDLGEQDYFLISPEIGAEILGIQVDQLEEFARITETGKSKEILKTGSEEITFFAERQMVKIETENVLGFIEGSDKKDEYIIITAHYDHIGMDGQDVFNGADDNGSGTVAIMEMAEAFALAKKNGHGPRRSVLFMALTGEEKGLLGSNYYVANPALPLDKTITNLNIDMIGRIDDGHLDNPEYVYLIGSDKLSIKLHDVSERVNSTYSQLELDYTYNADNDPNRFYYRSDHYNFAKNNIPIIFYFNGVHGDYHQTTDTTDKIAFEILEKRTRLIFHTAWEIANMEESISVDVMPNKIKIKGTN
jgi:hypothetical protein